MTGTAGLSGPLAPDWKPRILVAEDHPVNQKVILRLLDRLGHQAVLAPDGMAALLLEVLN